MTLTNDPPRGSFGPSPSRPLGGIPWGPWGAPRIGARGSTIGTAKRKHIYMKTGFEKCARFVTLTRLKKIIGYRIKIMKETSVKVHYTNISKLGHVLLFNQRTWIMKLYCQAHVSMLWYTKIIPEASRKLDWRKQKCSTSRTKGYCFTCHNDIDNKEDFNIFTKWNSSILGSILLHWHIPLGNKTSLFRFWKCFNKRLKLFTMCCLYSLSTFVSVTQYSRTHLCFNAIHDHVIISD